MDIHKLAEIYYRLNKRGGVLENMAARVLYSTIPQEKQLDNVPALESLIPGAKELVNYSVRAIVDELELGNSINWGTLRYQAHNSPREFLTNARELFLDPEQWAYGLGGKAWANITTNVIYLYDGLKKLMGTQKGTPEYLQALQEITAYMNVVDASIHNTGSLLDKIIGLEASDKRWDEQRQADEQQKIKRVLDAKELADPQHVMGVVLPIVEKMPERYLPFKDWASNYYRQAPEEDRHQKIENELKKIDLKKDMMKQIINPINEALSNKEELKHIGLIWLTGTVPLLQERMTELGLDPGPEPVWQFSTDQLVDLTDPELKRKHLLAIRDVVNKMMLSLGV